MTDPVWSHVLALSAWTLKKANKTVARKSQPRLQISTCKEIPHQLRFPSQTIPDCTRYIIGVFCCNL